MAVSATKQNFIYMSEYPLTLAALVIITRGWERFGLKITLDDARKMVYNNICCNQDFQEWAKDREYNYVDCSKLIADIKKDGGFNWL